MKRKIHVIMTVILCLLMLGPVCISAKTYELGGTDITLELDDSAWYVFTRENIKDNPELEELGVSYDYIYSTLYNNHAYMDAIIFYDTTGTDYVEMFVRTAPVKDSKVANLSNYTEKDVKDLGEALLEEKGIEDSSISMYEDDYKFAKLEYIDPTLDFNMCEFVTIVNGSTYVLTFQSTSPFTDEAYDEIEDIVDSVEFDVDPTLKEELKEERKESESNIWKNAVIGGIIGGAAGGIGGLITKKLKGKKKENTDSENSDTTAE